MSLIGLLLKGFGPSGATPDPVGDLVGTLEHSPAEILQQLIIDKLLATSPEDALDWPVFVSILPSKPDNALTCNDTVGRTHGRIQNNGRVPTHPGVQILLRSSSPSTGFVKLNGIASTLTQQVVRETVDVDGVLYLVHSLTQVGEVLSLGREFPLSGNSGDTSDSQLYSLGLLMSVKQIL